MESIKYGSDLDWEKLERIQYNSAKQPKFCFVEMQIYTIY
jgi:hypothetical protein